MYAEGIQRFCVGLGKKVLIANNIGQLWEITAATSGRSMLSAWLGILAYTMQIYYDAVRFNNDLRAYKTYTHNFWVGWFWADKPAELEYIELNLEGS
jgi:hypothetical protein